MAISTMLMGGAMLWFREQETTDFYNNSRQLDAYVRELQSESSSNIVPGFSGNAGCNTVARTNCPIKQNEEVFGTAMLVQGGSADPKFTIYYLKSSGRATPSAQPTKVEAYGTPQTYELPATVRYTGANRIPASGPCIPSGANYSQIARHDIGGDATGFQAQQPMMIVFRRQPSAYYVFTGGDASFGGAAGDMNSYGYTAPTATYRPCAATWEFEGGNATAPPQRTFEMIFNVLNTTTRLQTR